MKNDGSSAKKRKVPITPEKQVIEKLRGTIRKQKKELKELNNKIKELQNKLDCSPKPKKKKKVIKSADNMKDKADSRRKLIERLKKQYGNKDEAENEG